MGEIEHLRSTFTEHIPHAHQMFIHKPRANCTMTIEKWQSQFYGTYCFRSEMKEKQIVGVTTIYLGFSSFLCTCILVTVVFWILHFGALCHNKWIKLTKDGNRRKKEKKNERRDKKNTHNKLKQNKKKIQILTQRIMASSERAHTTMGFT